MASPAAVKNHAPTPERIDRASSVDLLDGSAVVVDRVRVDFPCGDGLEFWRVARLVGPGKGKRTEVAMEDFASEAVSVGTPEGAARCAGALLRHFRRRWN